MNQENDKLSTLIVTCKNCGSTKLIKKPTSSTVINGKHFADIQYRCMQCHNITVTYDSQQDLEIAISNAALSDTIIFMLALCLIVFGFSVLPALAITGKISL